MLYQFLYNSFNIAVVSSVAAADP
jgi:hypothetical protein